MNRVHKAIRNNIDLYQLVFDSHRLKYHSTDQIWYSLDQAPSLYSNLITLTDDWKPDEILRSIDEAAIPRHRKSWTIKDSYARLDLSRFGFAKLFEAQWIYLQADMLSARTHQTPLDFKILQDEPDLAAWKQAWGAQEEPVEDIFLPGLLSIPTVKFIGGYLQGQLLSGCMLNKTDDVFGLSNFFSPSNNPGYWSDILHFIIDEVESIDIVGYEPNDVVESLRGLGFKPVGNQVVWIKSES